MTAPTPQHDTARPTLFGREPVALIAVFQTILALAIGFGLDITPGQVGLIMAALTAVGGLLARSQVSPVEVIRARRARTT